jgi:hypothetical protein
MKLKLRLSEQKLPCQTCHDLRYTATTAAGTIGADERRPSGTAVFVVMYAYFQLARMIARPDLLIARPNLGAATAIEWVGISIAKFAAWIYLPGRLDWP